MDMLGLSVIVSAAIAILGVMGWLNRRAEKHEERSERLAVREYFANPGDFMSDFDLEMEYRRRLSQDPAGFAKRVGSKHSLAPSLAAAVLIERLRAVRRPERHPEISHDLIRSDIVKSSAYLHERQSASSTGQNTDGLICHSGLEARPGLDLGSVYCAADHWPPIVDPNDMGSWQASDPTFSAFRNEPIWHQRHDGSRISGSDAS